MFKYVFSALLALALMPSIAAAQTIDVYIIAGQSNTDGRGEVSDLTEAQIAGLANDTIISYVNPGSERERAEPQSNPADLDVGTDGFTALVPGGFSVDGTSARMLTPTFGPELSFGASIAEATGSTNQIAIIKVSRGGTNLRNDWLVNPNVNTVDDEPQGFLYRALLEQVADSLAELEEDGGTAIVRGVVWHQGESDSSTANVNLYAGRFADFVAGVRAEFGADIQFVLGELSRTRPNSVEFNNNLPNVAASAPGISFVSSEGLTTPADDTTHFDANGQLELGQRYANAIAEAVVPIRTVTFDFSLPDANDTGVANADPEGSNFDPSLAGDRITVGGLTATIVEVTAPEFDTTGDVPVLTGETTTNAATNVSNQRALGINNLTISNNEFPLVSGGTEGSDFNPGESLTFTFDQAVQFTSIELESVIAEDSFDVLVNGVAVLETTGDDSFIDLGGLEGLTIAAGSRITFAVDGVLGLPGSPSTSVRLESFAVEIIEAAPAPVLVGDVNQDTSVNIGDIPAFINILFNGAAEVPEADINGDTMINIGDIPLFVELLFG